MFRKVLGKTEVSAKDTEERWFLKQERAAQKASPVPSVRSGGQQSAVSSPGAVLAGPRERGLLAVGGAQKRGHAVGEGTELLLGGASLWGEPRGRSGVWRGLLEAWEKELHVHLQAAEKEKRCRRRGP